MSPSPVQISRRPAVAVVAHPDDETIWCGGLILQTPEWNWTIMSLCRADDTDRSRKFRRVCADLHSHCIMSDLDDSCPLEPIDPHVDIGERVMPQLGHTDWGLCLTHGSNGEYGHPRHSEIHREILRLVRAGALRCRELWCFAYECEAPSGHCEPSQEAGFTLELTGSQLAEKKRLVRQEYGFSDVSFEVQACIGRESFTRHPIARKGTNP